MKTPLLKILPVVFLLPAAALADSVTLTSGEKVEGKIISETPSEIVITVKVSASITDDRTIHREEIQKVEKTAADELAFEELKNLKPDPITSYSAATYEQIFTKLKSFQTQYPDSAHLADVKATLDVFQKEKDRIDAGEVKYYGFWLTKDEAAKRELQIRAQTLLITLKSKISQGDLIGALNTYDALEKDFSATRAYPIAVDLARQLLPMLSSRVNHAMDVLYYDTEAWKKGPEANSPQIIAARQAEQAGFNAMLDNAQKNQQKWPPFIARSEKSLTALKTLIPVETARLTALPVDKMNASLKDVDKARTAITAKDYASAETLLKEAATLWTQNEAATFWQNVLTERKAQETKAATEIAKATPTPKPTAKPADATAAAQATTPPPAEEENFFLTIKGGLTVLGGAVGLFGIVALVQKSKKSKEKEE